MSMPAVPPTWSDDLPTTNRPKDVDRAFLALMATVVLGVVASVLCLTLPVDMWVDLMKSTGSSVSGDPAITEEIYRAVGVVSAVFGLIIAAVGTLFAFLVRSGHNWARIVITVFGGITVLSMLSVVAMPGYFGAFFDAGAAGAAVMVLSIVDVVLTAAAIVFLFRPAANVWFRRQG